MVNGRDVNCQTVDWKGKELLSRDALVKSRDVIHGCVWLTIIVIDREFHRRRPSIRVTVGGMIWSRTVVVMSLNSWLLSDVLILYQLVVFFPWNCGG